MLKNELQRGAPFFFSSLTKVFWKGEFEGKNLFFKKGFPLIIKLEKTSLKGRQLAGDRKFFQGGRSPQNKKAGVSSRLNVILLRFKRNCAHCVRSVTAFQFFRFRTYSSPAAPSNSSANEDGSGTPAAGAE